jgi:MoaA/NifB/PqqE/SkfB family radical SAM enzyme
MAIKDKVMQAGIETYKLISRHHTFNVRQVKVETTKACNLKCPGCRRNYSASISTEPGPRHLTPGMLWRILATTNMMVVRFEGDGEPTCNPHFKDLVKMCGDLVPP